MAQRLNQWTCGVVAVASWLLVLLALWVATPARLKPIGVTLWFILLFLAIACALAVILDVLKRLFGPKKPQGREFKPSLRQGVLVSTWLTVMLALSSLRQLSLRDALLSAVLIIIIELYLRLT